MQNVIFFLTVFLILFINVTPVRKIRKNDASYVKKCYRFVPMRFSSCKRRCPQLLPNGRCNRVKGKWHCICKGTERGKKDYSLDEANCIQRVATGQQNPPCVTELCPFSFRDGGRIVRENGEWQWYCSAKEFDNDQESIYTLEKARSIYSACNGANPGGLKACRQQCPSSYQSGDCFLDHNPVFPRCGCTKAHKLSDWYGIKETFEVAKVCSSTVQDHKGCSQLCPQGFKYARCFSVAKVRFCGCKQSNAGVGWYTIPIVRQMIKVCNAQTKDNKGCKGLCPEGYKREGLCSDESGFLECLCLKEGANGHWVTLKEAIYNLDIIYDKGGHKSNYHGGHRGTS